MTVLEWPVTFDPAIWLRPPLSKEGEQIAEDWIVCALDRYEVNGRVAAADRDGVHFVLTQMITLADVHGNDGSLFFFMPFPSEGSVPALLTITDSPLGSPAFETVRTDNSAHLFDEPVCQEIVSEFLGVGRRWLWIVEEEGRACACVLYRWQFSGHNVDVRSQSFDLALLDSALDELDRLAVSVEVSE